MPTTPNMNLVIPTERASIDAWGGILNAALGVGGVDDHDHTTGKGVKIASAALKINADVAWAFGGTNFAITDIAAVDFAAVTAASVAGYAGALFVNSSDADNLYFRTISGTNVKITDGTTLNISVVGGIGGDYASVSALLDYDDASDTYRFRQETAAAVRQYAKLSSADLIIREYAAAGVAVVPPNTITIKSPAALAASYSITLPTAVPAGASVMQMSSAGVVSLSNTLPSLGTVTLDSNASVVLSGTGQIKHGTWQRGCMATADAITGGSVTSGASGIGTSTACLMAASTTVWIDITHLLQVGEDLTSVLLYTDEVTGTANSTFDLVLDRPSIALWNSSLTAAPTSSRATLPTPVTLTVSGSYVYVAGDVVRVVVTTAAASTRANYSLFASYTRA